MTKRELIEALADVDADGEVNIVCRDLVWNIAKVGRHGTDSIWIETD